MKYGIKAISGICICLAAACVATGCMTEDLSDCSRTQRFTVMAYANDGTDCGASVNDVILYVFGDDFGYLEEIETMVGETVLLDVPAKGQLHIYAWGNLCGGCQMRPTFDMGDNIDVGEICLHPDTRATEHHRSPDDLFHGSVSVSQAQDGGDTEIPIYRVTGSMSITVRKLKELAGSDDDDYSIVVRDTYNTYAMDAVLSGGRASYRPTGSFVMSGSVQEYSVPAFNLVPEQGGVSIDIYHGSDLLTTVSSHSDGQPITVAKGLLTHVRIEFNVQVNVSAELLPWGSTGGNKEF